MTIHKIPSISSTFSNYCYNCKLSFVQRSDLVTHLKRNCHAELPKTPDLPGVVDLSSNSVRTQPDAKFGADTFNEDIYLFRTDFRKRELLMPGEPGLPSQTTRQTLMGILARVAPYKDKVFMSGLKTIFQYERVELENNGFPIKYTKECRDIIRGLRYSILTWLRVLVEDVGLLLMRGATKVSSLMAFIHQEDIKTEVRLTHSLISLLAKHSMVLAKKQNASHEFSDQSYYKTMDAKQILNVEPNWFSQDTSWVLLDDDSDKWVDISSHPGTSVEGVVSESTSNDNQTLMPQATIGPSSLPLGSESDHSSIDKDKGVAGSTEPSMDSKEHFNRVGDETALHAHETGDNAFSLSSPKAKRGKLDEDLKIAESTLNGEAANLSSRTCAGIGSSTGGHRPGPISIEDGESWTSFSTRWIHAKASGYDTLVGRLLAHHCEPPRSSCDACVDRLQLLDGVYFSHTAVDGRWEWKRFTNK